jgi:uncharacterized membrane protein
MSRTRQKVLIGALSGMLLAVPVGAGAQPATSDEIRQMLEEHQREMQRMMQVHREEMQRQREEMQLMMQRHREAMREMMPRGGGGMPMKPGMPQH